MTGRRDKNKQQRAQLNRQLEPVEVKPREKDELLFELGKYCFDLSKLTCGAFVLTNILDISPYNKVEFYWGLIMMTVFLIAGITFIKRSSKKN